MRTQAAEREAQNSGVGKRLDCQPRKADADGQLGRGRLLIVDLAQGQNVRPRSAPENQNEKRWTRINLRNRQDAIWEKA